MFELTTSAPSPRPGDQQPVHEWLSLGRTILRRRRALFTIFGVFFGSVAVLTFLAPKTYTTSVRLIAGNSAAEASSANASTDLPILNALRMQSSVQTAETYAVLISQPVIAREVIADLKLPTTPDKVLAATTVKPVTNTSILQIDVAWRNADTSAAIANGVAQAFVNHERDLVTSSASAALDFVNHELPSAQAHLHDTQRALASYQSQHRIADIATQTQNTISTIATLDAKIASTQVDVRQNQAQLNESQNQLGREHATTSSGGSVSPNPVFAQLNSQLATTEVQLQTAEQQYTDLHPTVIALKQQVTQLRNRLAQTPPTIVSSENTAANPVYQSLQQQAANARGAIAAENAELGTLRAQRSGLEPALRALPSETNRLAELRSQATAAQDVVDALQKKATDATVSRSSTISDVTIVSPADPTAASVKPNIKTNLIVGFVVGLILGLSGAIFMDFLDNRIKDDDDLAELALPILASIPRVESRGRYALPWVRSLTVEAFLQLVTSLRYASDKPIRTLALTSPLQGDGKSSIAMNIAITLAEIHPRILIIDADLRRPSLHTKFSLRNECGLSDVIVGNATLTEAVRQTRHAGLDILTSGMRTPSPLRLLESERYEILLEQALEHYRMIIIDSPALGPVVDGAVLCKKADGAVLVVSHGMTDKRSTKAALARLSSVGVKDLLGIIVNRAEPKRSDYDDTYLGTQETTIALPSEF